MVQALWAAEFELDPGGRELLPPAIQSLQHRRHCAQSEGDASGNLPLTIESPQTPQRLPKVLAPPIPASQINSTAGGRTERLKQRIHPLRQQRIKPVEPWKNIPELLFNRFGPITAVTGLKTPRLATTAKAITLDAQLQPYDSRSGAATDSKRHVLGELSLIHI